MKAKYLISIFLIFENVEQHGAIGLKLEMMTGIYYSDILK